MRPENTKVRKMKSGRIDSKRTANARRRTLDRKRARAQKGR